MFWGFFGRWISCKGKWCIYKGVMLSLNDGVEITTNFLSLGLGNSDVIQGIQWLETFATLESN